MRAPLAALCVVLALAGRVAAAPSTVAVVVDVAPSTGDTWFAAALEETIARELSRFRLVTLAGKLDARACPDRAARCLVDRYRDAGVDIVVLGDLRHELLDYDVYATWLRGRSFDGSLAVAHVDAATLRRHIGDLVRPIVQRGGLVDERPARGAPAAPATVIATAPASRPLLLATLLVALMLLVALPPAWARLVMGAPREPARRARPASWKWSGALIAALGLVAVAAVTTDLPARVAAAAAVAGAPGELAAAVAAGMIWGAFALTHVSWVLSPIHGLGQARHDAIWPLLQSWLGLALLRACLLVAYVPLFWLALVVCDALGLPRRATFMLALPTVGLFIHFWLLTLVDNVAAYLDVHLVVGPTTARNPWHATIKRYFRGYLRRNGVDVDATLFERALFLPSALPGVVGYGGGFARPRILVGEQVRDAALGQLPDESELPERTVNPEELPFGFILPMPDGRKRARDATLHERSAEQRRHELTVAPARPRAAAPRVLGESATLLGWVMPQPAGGGVPLIADDNEELEVVRQLLTEHYAAFTRDDDDDEIDDTDPTQKDFLFAALLRELGRFKSRDTFVTTLRLAFALTGRKATRLRRWLVAATVGVYDRFLSGPAARVADAEAALNQALHPLIQYLAFLRGGAETSLTTRANAPRLIQTSKELLEQMDRAAIPTVERQLLAATPRNRLLWLSRLFHAPLARRADRALSTAAAVILAVVATGVLYVAVRDAVDYHPTYVERMRPAPLSQGAAVDERPTTKQ